MLLTAIAIFTFLLGAFAGLLWSGAVTEGRDSIARQDRLAALAERDAARRERDWWRGVVCEGSIGGDHELLPARPAGRMR